MFTIWINDICFETIPINFLLAGEIAKKMSSQFPGQVDNGSGKWVSIVQKMVPCAIGRVLRNKG